MSNLIIDPAIEQKLIDLAINHIKKVEANPDVKTEGDNFDYWNSYELPDGNFIDYNIYCGDEWCELKQDSSGKYVYTNPNTWSWDVTCYHVDPPNDQNKYHQIDTGIYKEILNYNKNQPHTK
jgi:hypothetical protein